MKLAVLVLLGWTSAALADITVGVSVSMTGPGASLGLPISNTFSLLPKAIGSEAAEGFFHEFYGWLHFIAALGLLFAANWLLKRISRLYEQRQVAHVQ